MQRLHAVTGFMMYPNDRFLSKNYANLFFPVLNPQYNINIIQYSFVLIRVPGWMVCLVYLDKYNVSVVQIPGMMMILKTVYVWIAFYCRYTVEKDSRGCSQYFSMFTSNWFWIVINSLKFEFMHLLWWF